MNAWRPYPMLRLAFPFLAGIVTSGFLYPPGYRLAWMPYLLIFTAILSWSLSAATTGRYRFRWVTGLSEYIFLLLAGYEIAILQRPEGDPTFLGMTPSGLFIAAVAEPPANSSTGFRAVVEVRYRMEQQAWKPARGWAIAYLTAGKSGVPLMYGEHILLHGDFTEITDNSNPHSFNYAAYLRNRGITHRIFAGHSGWARIGLPAAGLIRQAAFRIRDRLLDILRDNRVEGKEFAVAAALLLGYTGGIDADLRNDYAATGAMHILSVSGMHVGIIYLFLEFMLGFLNRRRAGRVIKTLLLLACIWFYALLTGLSPSVLRSAAMLSLPIIGRSMNRSPDMYNILAASALFILALDPFLIWDTGFQLSYLAVIGIVVLYKPVYDLYVTSAWFPDKIWSLLAVSIAAQIATMPVTLYVFHRFPNYFLLTNLLVVPLSSLIIYSGIVTLAVGGIPVVCSILAKGLVFLVRILNSVIHFIEQLPGSSTNGIFISGWEMILLFIVIAALFLFFTGKRIIFLLIVYAAVIGLNLSRLDFNIRRLRSHSFLVLNARNEALYCFTAQDRAAVFYGVAGAKPGRMNGKEPGEEGALLDASGIRHRRYYWLYNPGRPMLPAKSFVPLAECGNFLLFSDCRIAIVSRPPPKGLNRAIHADILVITGNPKLKLEDICRIYHPGIIIADATNSRFRVNSWLAEVTRLGVSFHAVTLHGAFQKEF